MTALSVAHPGTGEALPPFLTARQTAALLDQSEVWVAAACARDELPHLPHVGSAPWRIPTMQLLKLLGFDTFARPSVSAPALSDRQPLSEADPGDSRRGSSACTAASASPVGTTDRPDRPVQDGNPNPSAVAASTKNGASGPVGRASSRKGRAA